MTSERALETDASSKPVRRAVVFGLAIGVPASLVFLWLAFRNADVGDVWDAARGAEPEYVALALLTVAAVYVLQAARWQRIAQTARPSTLRYLELVVGAVACNNVLPGRLGELFRARWLAVAAAMPSGRALATVGLDRGSDVVVLFVFLVVSLPFAASEEWIREIVIGGALLILVLLVLFAAARGYARFRHRDRRERGRVRRIARDVVDTLAEPLGRRLVAAALGLSALAWGAFALAVWLVARALGIELGFLECLFVTAVLNLGVAIPSSPGFVGTYQWLSVAALGVFDVLREDALAFSFLLQASWFIPTTVIGGFLVLFRLDWGFGGR